MVRRVSKAAASSAQDAFDLVSKCGYVPFLPYFGLDLDSLARLVLIAFLRHFLDPSRSSDIPCPARIAGLAAPVAQVPHTALCRRATVLSHSARVTLAIVAAITISFGSFQHVLRDGRRFRSRRIHKEEVDLVLAFG